MTKYYCRNCGALFEVYSCCDVRDFCSVDCEDNDYDKTKSLILENVMRCGVLGGKLMLGGKIVEAPLTIEQKRQYRLEHAGGPVLG